MNLERTERNLTRMQELADPALEDVLNYIYDFCQDVKDDTGSAVDHLDCRDEDAMYRRLPWLGRTVSRLGAKLAPEVGEESRKARLEELSGELETLAAQVEAAERENSDALGIQHALEAEITAQNTALEEKNSKISGLEGELESLKQQSADLDAREEELKGQLEAAKAALETEEALLRLKNSEAAAGELKRMEERTKALKALREKVLKDWKSDWGKERAEFAGAGQSFDEILGDGLEEIRGRIKRCDDGLRAMVRAMSSTDFE